jgi:hypothetical protein
MILSTILWVGLLVALVALVCFVRPLRFLGIRTRSAAAWVLAASLGAILLALVWPARTYRSEGNRAIDRFMPVYHAHEFHETRVQAPPEEVYRAIREVRADEIRFLKTLMGIRSLPSVFTGRRRQFPDGRPILDIATGSSFLYLADEPPRELVVGTVGRFWGSSGGVSPRPESPEAFLAFDLPGYARAVMNFVVEPQNDGWSRVTTETRVFAPESSVRLKFTIYWRFIYPGSSLSRYGWLEAVRRRAEPRR